MENEPTGVAEQYLKLISEKTKGRPSIYRGQAQEEWKLRNGAERRIINAVPRSNSLSARDLQESFEDYHHDMLEDARQRGFGLMDGRELSDLEVLAKLQHFGADTALLDFTRRAAVALYFVCSGTKPEVNGKVFILETTPFQPLSAKEQGQEITSLFEKGKPRIFRPTLHGDAERRILSQSGLFMINLWHDHPKLKSIIVESDDMNDILEDLRKVHNVSPDSLFMDLSGFAQHWSNESNLDEYVYRGIDLARKKKYAKAIELYTKAINFNSENAPAYFNRGRAYTRQKKYNDAIRDYTKVIQINPNHYRAYNNRGVVKKYQRKYEDAISDYTEAIWIKRDYSLAHINRGKAEIKMGNYMDAILNFEDVLKFDPENAVAKSELAKARKYLDEHPESG